MARLPAAPAQVEELPDVLLGVLDLLGRHVDARVPPAADELDAAEEHVPQGLVALGGLGRTTPVGGKALENALPRPETCWCMRRRVSEEWPT